MISKPEFPRASLFFRRGLAVGALLLGLVVWTACDSGGSGMDEPTEDAPDQISYDLEAQSNDGALSDGVGGTVTFWRASDNQTLVTLELDDGATGTELSHPAHIHENSAEEGGDIAFYLSPIDGTGGGGTSARLIDRPIEDLADFDGYVNIHESVEDLGIIVSQGNIGANAEGTEDSGLDLVDDPRTETHDLAAVSNGGDVAPNGVPGEVTFRELTSDQTLVTLELGTDGATGASVSHPAHIHNNSALEGGEIAEYLSPIDGSDADARSSKLVDQSFDELADFDGYVNIHESAANLGAVVSQGDIGANADQRQNISYDLSAQSNSGAVSEGVNGTATFWELSDDQTLVTLELDNGATGTELSHTAHIHENSAEEGGGIAEYLTPIDGTGGGGTSARVVDRSITELANFDGYINIHESLENQGTIISQGNVGSNAEGTVGEGLEVVDDPRSETYDLAANSNGGDVAPSGIPGEVTFNELTSGQTLVTLTLDPGTENGATGANVSHPAHIHNNAASEGGEIAEYLSPVDGSDPAARSSKIVGQSYDNLTSFDGYVNLHESAATLEEVVSQGNVGANADGSGGGSGGY